MTVWERLAEEPELLVDLGSDQTSLHNPFNGGYYPVQLGFQEAQKVRLNEGSRQNIQTSTVFLSLYSCSHKKCDFDALISLSGLVQGS